MIKVLIVEDDPMVAEFNRRYLAKIEGFTVVAVAKSVAETQTLLDTHEIDLMLLDIFMPGTNGLELLSRLRKKDKSIDVIVISAACDSSTIKKALRHGAVDYLIKPFEFERFEAALAAYRDRAMFMKKQNVINQHELDQHIFYKDQTAQHELPKGLDRNTLKLVWEYIKERKDVFTTKEAAERVGISRVSMRKYLDFCARLELLSKELTFGSVGRPVCKYRVLHSGENTIKRYF
jgi:two-component system, CitB family, response regulator MalR